MNWVNVTFLNKEGFTPQQVEDIIQPDGSHIIGTADPEYITPTGKKNETKHSYELYIL
jgi:hypothetical protein